jgi:hypothetical protein
VPDPILPDARVKAATKWPLAQQFWASLVPVFLQRGTFAVTERFSLGANSAELTVGWRYELSLARYR